jgi:hypothetical protein
MATLITPGAGTREVLPANGRTFELPELQQLVGGYIEALRVPEPPAAPESVYDLGDPAYTPHRSRPSGGWLFINEDGKGLGLPLNQTATILMINRIAHDDYIVGNAVLCSKLEAGEGDRDGE